MHPHENDVPANHDPLQPHSHDPNLEPPEGDGAFNLLLPDGRQQAITPSQLNKLPHSTVARYQIVSTGHGTSGPFTFGGVALSAFVHAHWSQPFVSVELVSADGFGNRVTSAEIHVSPPAGPILLATMRDGQPLTRTQGLVRLIVPSETDDALRQVKWLASVRVVA